MRFSNKRAGWYFAGFLLYGLTLSGLFELRAIWRRMKLDANAFDTLSRIAGRQRIPFDQRTPLEAYSDLLKESPMAVTHLSPVIVFSRDEMTVRGRAVLPLGNVSSEVLLGAPEMGEWRKYVTDEHGFRNPHGLFSQAPIDILVLGDSFAVGESVRDGENIADRLRENFPKTINLGLGDNGPLMELASLREYGAMTRPKRVIWFFYEGNDIPQITQEAELPILKKYLERDDFKQDISAIQSEVDLQLRAMVKKRFNAFKHRSSWSRFLEASAGFPNKFFDILYFRELRRAVGISEAPALRVRHDGRPDQLEIFASVAAAIQRECEKLNAKLTFVYLPEWLTFRIGERQDRAPVLSIIRSLKIPMVDGIQVFRRGRDALDYYPLRYHGHFTPEGHRAIAKALLDHLGNREGLRFTVGH